MTKRTQRRLRQIVGRDTRAIRSFLGIIEQHEDKLLMGGKRLRINESELDRLTMTAFKVKTGSSQRVSVPHDMKVKFPRMSQNELNECRQTAVALYESYLQKIYRGIKASRPCSINGTRRIPRFVFSRRFNLINHDTATARWWLDLRDALDSAPQGKRVHDRLPIPLKISPFHLDQFERGDIKALRIFTDSSRKWWVAFAVKLDVPSKPDSSLPKAVLGIDLGIKKAACATLVTPSKVRDTRYFIQKDKAQILEKYDRIVESLQRKMDTYRNRGKSCEGIAHKLRNLKHRRENVAKEYDRVLVAQIIAYIEDLSEKYLIYVAVGRLRNIRMKAKRGNYRGRGFRGMVHRWAFSRITENLKHQLAQIGWPVEGKDSRLKVLPEAWTSIMCWKCGKKGTRPKQNLFVCPTCGNKTNADRNGAINIAGRLVTLTKYLHSVRGLGKWADSVQNAGKRLRPKARGKTRSSRRKSLLPSRGIVSDLGESAAVHFVQSDLASFSDETGKSDNDPAVVNTVETLSDAGSDAPVLEQEDEIRSMGGMPSR
ncbi:MAG: zinc ribbon domain-containing protein [Candidatus Thorarchaeota archaeon]